jgi:plasmid stabilization system protein ParE
VSFRVRFTREAQADLERLFDFVLERELPFALVLPP